LLLDQNILFLLALWLAVLKSGALEDEGAVDLLN
jgi:hypothetical protein